MAISDQITALTTDKTNIANAITSKGGTVNSGDGFDNFATDIGTIQTAKEEQSKTLTLGSATPTTVTPDTGKVLSSVPVSIDSSVIKAENIAQGTTILGIAGTHSGGGGGRYGIETANIIGDVNSSGVLQPPEDTSGDIVFTGVKSLYDDALYYRFYRQNSWTHKVIFPDLTTVSNQYAVAYGFGSTSSLSGVELNALTTVSGSYAFYYAFYHSGIKYFKAPVLKTISSQYGCGYLCSICTSLTSFDLSSLESIGPGGCAYMFNGCKSLTNAVLPKVKTITGAGSMNYMFQNCTSLVSSSVPSLESISYSQGCYYMFAGCTNHEISDFSNLKNLAGQFNFYYAFSGNSKLRIVKFNNLQTVGTQSSSVYSIFKYAFNNCTLLTSLLLPELTTIRNMAASSSSGHFSYNNKLQKVYLPKFTIDGTNGKYIFYNCSAITELHFGIENQSTVSGLDGYSSRFGVTNATIYFDLVNHITVDGTVYDRSGNEYEWEDGYYSWKNGSTVIYTTNAYTPAAGDTTYTKSGSTYTAGSTITAVS